MQYCWNYWQPCLGSKIVVLQPQPYYLDAAHHFMAQITLILDSVSSMQ
jgi:hypothetical protein